MAKILLALAVLVPYAVDGIIISFVNPVFPLLAQSHQAPSMVEGLLFSFFAIPQLLVFLYAPSMEHKCGVKNTFIIHLLINAVSVLFLGGLHYIYSPALFSIWGFFCRMLNGFGDAGITYQFRPIAKRLLPSHFALMNELSWATASLTFGIGPLISAPIYAHYGFDLVCFFVALLALLGAIQVCCSLSARQCEP